MAQLQLKHIPLADLHVSKLNMRHGRKKPDVSDILPLTRKGGVRQTLLVRADRVLTEPRAFVFARSSCRWESEPRQFLDPQLV